MMKSALWWNARLIVNDIQTIVLYNHCTLSLDTHISIGGSVIEMFEPSVQPLIDSSLVLASGE